MQKIAVITDIHGAQEPLESILEDINQKGITEIYCLGDIVGYGPNSIECLELIQKNKVKCIIGNHELYYLAGDEVLTIFPYLAGRNQEEQKNLLWTNESISKHPELTDFIKNMPEYFILKIGNISILLTHFPIDFSFNFKGLWNYKEKGCVAFENETIETGNLVKKIAQSNKINIVLFGHNHFIAKTETINGIKYIPLVGVGSGHIGDKTEYTIITENDDKSIEIKPQTVIYNRQKLLSKLTNNSYIGVEFVRKFFGNVTAEQANEAKKMIIIIQQNNANSRRGGWFKL